MAAHDHTHNTLTETDDMELDTLIFSLPHDENSTPVRLSSTLWTRILAAAHVNGGLIQERYSVSEARQFARALRAALEPPPPAAEQPRRFAVFQQPRPDTGLPLRQAEVRGDVDAVLAVFEEGAVLVQSRATPSAMRALPSGGVSGAGHPGRVLPLARPAAAR